MSQGTENKSTGSFYTPTWCVELLLLIAGFDDVDPRSLLEMELIDPACGDGAILCRIAEKSIEAMRGASIPDEDIARWIENNLFGIELEPGEALKCRRNIEHACNGLSLDVEINDGHIICADALASYRDFLGRFDFVIGNPPYVRIHNLDEKPESAYITGMCDLYYAFFDIAQQILCSAGRMCFIAPSSWMTNEAGQAMRDALMEQENLTDFLDFAHYQVFDNATTYTAIVALDAPSPSKSDSYRLEAKGIRRWRFVEEELSAIPEKALSSEDVWCAGRFYARGSSGLSKLLSFDANAIESNICVRNGYATLMDKAYISTSGTKDCAACEIDVVKASKGALQKAIYPYDKDGNLLSLDDIRKKSEGTYEHLLSLKERLLARNKVDAAKWWGYGRSQGIADTYTDKLSIQSIVRPGKDVVIAPAPAGVGVYGGLYVTGISEDALRDAIEEPLFMDYIVSLAKYKQGGYYTFSGKELERYLRFWKSCMQ